MLFVCVPQCSTCRKAQTFLEERGLPFQIRNIKTENPAKAELQAWHAQSGLPLKRFFNTSGLQYRALNLAQKLPSLNEDEQLSLLASDGMLVKRPILIFGETVLVGFKQAQWEAALLQIG